MPNTSQRRIPSLDGLRGVAATTVAISHFSLRTSALDQILGHGAGQLGVMLFFCLSGYLMASLYFPRPCSRQSASKFGQHRIARIGPLFLLVFAASLWWEAIAGSAWPLYDVHLSDLIGLTEPGEVLWTIPVEVQFYFVFPFLWASYRRSTSVFVSVVMALAALAVVTPLFTGSMRPFYGLFFLAGSLVAPMPPLPRRIMNWIFVATLAAYIGGFPEILQRLGVASVRTAELPYYLWRQPGYLLLIPLLLWSAVYSPVARWLLGNRVACYLGNISYSVYLLHLPILLVLCSSPFLRENRALLFLTFGVLTLTAAALSFRYIEVPARRAINRIGSPRSAALAVNS